MKTSMPKSMNSVPKGKAGSRTVDHPSMGGVAKAANNKTMPSTSPMGGKCPGGMGGSEKKKCSDPGVKCHAQGPQGKQAGGY
jgi:hypothetical protein